MTGTRLDAAAEADWLPAVGTGRPMRALVTAGWSIAEQARRCGWSGTMIGGPLNPGAAVTAP